MKKININCVIGGTGYGITSLNILKKLYAHNIEVSLFPIGQDFNCNNEEEKNIVLKCIKNAEKFDSKSPCLKIWHQHDLAQRVGEGKYYAYPFFELDTFTDLEKHHLNNVDYLFTSSQWAKQVLLSNNIKVPITVCPLAVDMQIFFPPPKIRIKKPNYVFFNIGKWEIRKSHDFLIKAFNLAFTEKDNVELWLVPHNPFLSEEESKRWIGLVENSRLKNKIRIFDRLPTQYHLAEVIFNGDCGVFLSRAEGWNNEILETMAINRPVIATNFSAHTEYCTRENSYLVDIDEKEPANDGKWFHGQGSWAKLSDKQLAQTIEYMRYVYINRIYTNPAGLNTAKKYTWDNTASIIEDTMQINGSFTHAYTKKKRKRR